MMPQPVPGQAAPSQTEERQIPVDLAPTEGEAAVLSLLAARDGSEWAAVAGSLLTVPESVARISWPEWGELQPPTRGPRAADRDPDLGAIFTEEPFAGIRMTRAIIGREVWRGSTDQVEAGSLETSDSSYRFAGGTWSASKLFAQYGLSDAHRVIRGARRPVRGVALATQAPKLGSSDSNWVPGGSSKPLEEQSREELLGKEIFNSWPNNLLGIDWYGGSEHPPPHSFVVGRVQGGIWIADVAPDHDNNQLRIVLAWEADQIDPFACSLLVRAEQDEASLFSRIWRISDLPGDLAMNEQGEEPRHLGWTERTITVLLPRGARRTDWGMSLLGPDGSLLDERPVAPRVDRLEFSMYVAGASGPASTSIVGDRSPAPTEAERDQEVAEARELEEQTRAAAAHRRLATADELEHYLRWRFSARAGELLVLDRYLLHGPDETIKRAVEFIARFGRPTRALVSKVSDSAPSALAAGPEIQVRKLPHDAFHDRVWIVGESGLSVGASVNRFLREGPSASIPATTAVDLPFADTAAWRERFETWWVSARPL
jgi:hypothetical protein